MVNAGRPVAPGVSNGLENRCTRERTVGSNPTPSANLVSRDILFPLLIRSRKPAERGVFRPFVRTMRTGWRAHFGRFAVSLAPLSPKQPNHGRFGTVVRSLPDQWVMRCQLGRGFESAALRRSEQGSNHSIQYGCRGDKDRAPRGCSWRWSPRCPAGPDWSGGQGWQADGGIIAPEWSCSIPAHFA